MLLSVCTYICVLISTNACFYVQIEGFLVDVPPNFGVSSVSRTSGVGLFTYQDRFDSDFTCSAYTSDMVEDAPYFDASFTTARVFGGLANGFIALSMVLLIVMSCMEFAPAAIKGVGCMLIAGSVFELLTFTIFGSDLCEQFTSCKFSVGAGFAIAAFTLSFMTGMLCFKIPPVKERENFMPPPAPQPQVGTQTTTEVIMPGGTKKVTKTTVNADGSKTVEETVTE